MIGSPAPAIGPGAPLTVPPDGGDGAGGGGDGSLYWPGPPAIAIVGSAIAAKSRLEIAIVLEVFIIVPMCYDPPIDDRIQTIRHRPVRFPLIIKRATDAPVAGTFNAIFRSLWQYGNVRETILVVASRKFSSGES
jgi:hypothetical protein